MEMHFEYHNERLCCIEKKDILGLIQRRIPAVLTAFRQSDEHELLRCDVHGIKWGTAG
jgi:hypothetical protein